MEGRPVRVGGIEPKLVVPAHRNGTARRARSPKQPGRGAQRRLGTADTHRPLAVADPSSWRSFTHENRLASHGRRLVRCHMGVSRWMWRQIRPRRRLETGGSTRPPRGLARIPRYQNAEGYCAAQVASVGSRSAEARGTLPRFQFSHSCAGAPDRGRDRAPAEDQSRRVIQRGLGSARARWSHTGEDKGYIDYPFPDAVEAQAAVS
jgi:hypothetical protein